MNNKLCIRCKLKVVASQGGKLCDDCIHEMADYINLYYDIKYLAGLMGVSERTARRRAHAGDIPGKKWDRKRYLFINNIIDEWDKAGQPIPFIPDTPIVPITPPSPTNPLQEEAAAMCRKKDHSWLSDPKYDGIAYTSEQTTVKQTKYTVLAGYNRTCYFCKYSTFILA